MANSILKPGRVLGVGCLLNFLDKTQLQNYHSNQRKHNGHELKMHDMHEIPGLHGPSPGPFWASLGLSGPSWAFLGSPGPCEGLS